jgi:hypothetical protein
MTTTRRVDALEAELDPTSRVVAWLEEAHAYGSIEAYTATIIAGGVEALPLQGLIDATAASARRSAPRDPGQADAYVRLALRATLFRVLLATRIMETTMIVLREARLVHLAMSGAVILALEKVTEGWMPLTTMRDFLFERVNGLLIAEEARRVAEERYLGGHQANYPDVLAGWAEHDFEAKKMAVAAMRICELEGLEPLDEDRFITLDPERITRNVADLVEPARIRTLEMMGDDRAAAERLVRWLERSLASRA